MINVYLYAANKTQLDFSYRIIKKCLLSEHSEPLLHCATTNPCTLLKASKRKKQTGLYFLDMEAAVNLTETQLVSNICELDPGAYIVFLTSTSRARSCPYLMGTIDFIWKELPQISEEITLRIRSAIKSETLLHESGDDLLPLQAGNSTVFINREDILYIESDITPHYLLIHTTNGTRRISCSLKEFMTLLDGRFHRCHNSIIVNLHHVIYYSASKHFLQLDNLDTCPVSVRLSSITRSILLEPV